MDDHEIARLLARREGASVLEKEATFERVMDQLERQKRRELGPFWAPASSWAKRVGVTAVVVASAWLAWVRAPQPEEWTARGIQRAEPELKLACVESSVGSEAVPCAQGRTLTFDLGGAFRDSYFAAVARRGDDALIWYQPTPDGMSIPARTGLLGQGIRLGSEHTPGRYRVIAVLSKRPLSRAAIRTVLDRPKERGADVEIVERTLEVVAP